MYKNKKSNNKNGITLIALIITIIVMLILVAVTISMAINGGLFEKAGEAVGDTKNEINKEQGLANGGITIDGTYYNSIDEYLGVALHDWTRTGDTFTCSHCSATYEMGQYVNYTANGEKTSTTISAEKSGLDKYYTANSNSYPTDANVDENGNQIIEKQNTNWVVLGIEDTNKDGKYETLLITSGSQVLVTADASKGLFLYGAAAYNNTAGYVGTDGKKVEGEIDRICRELYSNSEYGIARGMTIEDVNSCLNNPLQAMSLGGMYYSDNSGKEYTTGNLTTKLKDLPIWNTIKVNHYTPDGANTEEALGEYELDGYWYRNMYGTVLVNNVNETTSQVTEVERNTLFGSSGYYLYWLASRGVRSYPEFASFGPGFVGMGCAGSCYGLFYSGIPDNNDGTPSSDVYEYGCVAFLRPVVPLASKLPEGIDTIFTIEGLTCNATNGMTWREWLNSSFYILGAYGIDYNITADGKVEIDNKVIHTSERDILVDDVIVPGCEYFID